MSKIYITGHKNPDMDSIAAAYSYSVLKNKIDPDNQYIPVALGAMNSISRSLFERLGIKSLDILKDTFSKVKDVCKRPTLILEPEDPIYELVNMYNQTNPSVVPIMKDGIYKGLLSVDDINKYFLRENYDSRPVYSLDINNIRRVVKGFMIKRGSVDDFVAPIMVGAMRFSVFKKRLKDCKEKPLLVVGCRNDHIAEAIKEQIPGLILTGVEEDSLDEIDFSGFNGFVYASHEDTAETIRLLRLSVKVETLLIPSKEINITQDMLFDSAKGILADSNKRGLPVFDKENGSFMGFITRRCFLERPRTKLILVDHNEASQSVKGIEDAEIVEIIDHHRLDAVKTTNPISITAMPVGSTCTIVFEQFNRYNQEIDPLTAKVLLAGIASDTVMLKSPTTTSLDRNAVKTLCAIASVDFEAFGKELFSKGSSLSSVDAKSAISSDFKVYTERGVKFGIGQIEVTTLDDIDEVSDNYLAELEKKKEGDSLDWAMLLVTNVLTSTSILLCTNYKNNYRFEYEELKSQIFSLPGVLSRKKQLLPEVIRVLES
ncbi:putative manganese-dependent inorganic diphosphatase [Bullifex porci]|uniref:putative manganese-dependent inorganic diphosphatase n=1 Tax=Bullifex porci TaxID=2606638 RepID=UPI0023F09606|nr:putative manganese-dependent inorganic diphosphatase [Bullifex porci]MDD7256456.1 putative manganese-dependent inorganic diphosphatase [Bullifex porci]MDY2741315.1 putative manganese-dependent inorganic diphosphatase [Bullifex porci]